MEHAESEGDEYKCENCKDGEWIRRDHCPDCTDESEDIDDVVQKELEANQVQRLNMEESEDYDEPRPEDEEWLRQFEREVKPTEHEKALEKLGIDRATSPQLVLISCIERLKSELQDVREEVNAEKRAKDQWYKRFNTLQERIEEAREKVEGVLNSEYGVGELDNALKILSEDLDEVDGECA